MAPRSQSESPLSVPERSDLDELDVFARRRAREEQARQENWLSTVLESIGDGVVTTDLAGCVIHLNRMAERLTGWTNSQAAGRHCKEILRLVHEGTGEEISSWFTPEHPGAPPRGMPPNACLLSRDGRRIPVGDTITTIHETAGGAHGFVVVFRDRTAEKAVLAALDESRRRLERAERLEVLGRFAAGIAHDFNNVVTAIQGLGTEIRNRLPMNSAIRSDMEDILAAATHGSGLARQLLDYGRGRAIRPSALEVGQHLRDQTRILARLLGPRIDLVVRVEERLARVTIDASQLEQLVMNLVVNARDAMPGGGAITIRAANVLVDAAYAEAHGQLALGRYVMISVADTGTGIDESVRARIFEPFFTTKAPGQGTGLGLATVSAIVRQYAGALWLTSQNGTGTTFEIYLPAADAAATAP